MKPNLKREWLGVLILILLIAAFIFFIVTCKAAKASEPAYDTPPDPAISCVDWSFEGPYYRLSPEDQAYWRAGHAIYFNIVDGRHFPVDWAAMGQDELFYSMVVYHAERMQNYLEYWAVAGGFPWPPPDAGLIITLAALRWDKDPRLAPAAGINENFQCFGYTGNDPYGMKWFGADFKEATEAFFRNLATNPAYAGCGSEPSLIDRVYNPWSNRGQYWENFENVFWAVR